ncbi:hypothetical protein KGP17_15445 [Serratia sp. JSRIV001]|uniref:hypothetical protein n=1 Tax=Serratia sp. JSRIV001 TaxID=2831893 RepID=UPI001CBAC90D|nr:hypothetical protein [Serratia sp. JSRIV001]UAN43879.1 hypothetical protein KGP17_15445 [Serratia sp. JSRIV001]
MNKKFFVCGVIDNGQECERVSDAEAKFWTVYELQIEGTSQAIFDCDNRDNADLAAKRLNQLSTRVSVLTDAISFSMNPMLWCKRESDIFQYRGKVWYADVLKSAIEKDVK